MTLSEMRQLLETRGIRLTKSLGQNFLHDTHQLQRIVAVADMQASDKILEIGPGLGPLTELLLQHAGEVMAIEKDARLVQVLFERFDGLPALHLVHEDALNLLKQGQRDWSGWKLVSNLPYSVASPILVEVCQGTRSPQKIVATLQLEVAQRLMAGPGGKDYGVLTLLVQLEYEPVRWFKIPAGCFFPRPDVDSACIVLERRSTLLLPDPLRPVYVRIVKRAFSQRRKMMFKLLKPDWPEAALTAAFARLNIPLQERAEKIGVEQFVKLTKLLASEQKP